MVNKAERPGWARSGRRGDAPSLALSVLLAAGLVLLIASCATEFPSVALVAPVETPAGGSGPPVADRPAGPAGPNGAGPAQVAAAPAGARAVPIDVVDLGGGSIVVLVAVTISGQGPFSFVLDTGASKSAVDRQVAQQAQLPALPLAIGQVAGVGGSGTAQVFTVQQWHAGDVALPAGLVAGLDLALQFGNRQAQGLLGSDVLSQFGMVTIDYAHAQLLLP